MPDSDTPNRSQQQLAELQHEVETLQAKNRDLEARLEAYAKINSGQTSLINKLVEKAPFGIMFIGDDHKVIHANAAAAKIFGTSADKMTSQHCERYFKCYRSDSGCPAINREKDIVLQPTECMDPEKFILHSAFTSDEGSENIVVETFVDISEIKKAEQELLKVNQTKDEFLAMISHEFRTPLNAIQGYGSLLQDEIFQLRNPDAEQYIEKILSASDLLHRIVNDILELSDLTAGKIKADNIPVDISMIVSQLQYRLEKEFVENNNTLELDIEAIPPFEQDLALLMKVLYEILANANKFTENGKVTFSAKLEQKDGADWLNFTIKDTGCGMTEETIKQIFTAFHQADSSLSRAYEGLGLGLSLVEKILHIINGYVDVTSKLGEGSTFSVYLPYDPV